MANKVNQGECPKCKSNNLRYFSGELDTKLNQYVYNVTCDCGFSGKECYNLKFTGFVDDSGKEAL